MRKIKITEGCFVKGQHVEPGVTLDLEPQHAASVVAAGKGVEVTGREKSEEPKPAAKKAAKKAAKVEHRDPEPENRDEP